MKISTYLSLLYQFALKETKVKYKSPLLGFLWMFFLPLSMVLIFKVVFSLIVKVSIPGYPFFIFLTLGVFPWNFLATSLAGTVNSLVDNEALIKKVYFPRQIIPLSIILGNLFNFMVSNLIILIFAILFKVSLSKFIVFLPLLIIVEFIFTSGLAFFFSSLQVLYRDVKYLVEILLLIWFYISPVFYPLSLVAQVSEKFLNYYLLNPLVPLLTLYRIVYLKDYVKILPSGLTVLKLIIYLVIWTLLVCTLGCCVFSRLRKRFTDFL